MLEEGRPGSICKVRWKLFCAVTDPGFFTVVGTAKVVCAMQDVDLKRDVADPEEIARRTLMIIFLGIAGLDAILHLLDTSCLDRAASGISLDDAGEGCPGP